MQGFGKINSMLKRKVINGNAFKSNNDVAISNSYFMQLESREESVFPYPLMVC